MSEAENKIEPNTGPISPKEEKTTLSKLTIFSALLSLFIIIILVVFSFYFYTINVAYQKQLKSLSDELATQSSQQSTQLKQALKTQDLLEVRINKTNIQLKKISNNHKIVKTDIQSLQRRFSETNVRHPNDWILAEVEYLIALSGRKIWLERDINTAIALLVVADQRIVELNDASLSPLRSALLDDINVLEALPRIDTDGVILTLTSLERRVDKLGVSRLLIEEVAVDLNKDLSSDISDWDTNLIKSLYSFIDNFIKVNHRDSKVEALLSPEQSWYLKEHLRNNLAKAEFAVYRHQQGVYDIALKNMIALLKNYYDITDNNTLQFYESVQRLSKHKIVINYPSQLKSVPLLERILEQRMKKSLTSTKLK